MKKIFYLIFFVNSFLLFAKNGIPEDLELTPLSQNILGLINYKGELISFGSGGFIRNINAKHQIRFINSINTVIFADTNEDELNLLTNRFEQIKIKNGIETKNSLFFADTIYDIVRYKSNYILKSNNSIFIVDNNFNLLNRINIKTLYSFFDINSSLVLLDNSLFVLEFPSYRLLKFNIDSLIYGKIDSNEIKFRTFNMSDSTKLSSIGIKLYRNNVLITYNYYINNIKYTDYLFYNSKGVIVNNIIKDSILPSFKVYNNELFQLSYQPIFFNPLEKRPSIGISRLLKFNFVGPIDTLINIDTVYNGFSSYSNWNGLYIYNNEIYAFGNNNTLNKLNLSNKWDYILNPLINNISEVNILNNNSFQSISNLFDVSIHNFNINEFVLNEKTPELIRSYQKSYDPATQIINITDSNIAIFNISPYINEDIAVFSSNSGKSWRNIKGELYNWRFDGNHVSLNYRDSIYLVIGNLNYLGEYYNYINVISNNFTFNKLFSNSLYHYLIFNQRNRTYGYSLTKNKEEILELQKINFEQGYNISLWKDTVKFSNLIVKGLNKENDTILTVEHILIDSTKKMYSIKMKLFTFEPLKVVEYDTILTNIIPKDILKLNNKNYLIGLNCFYEINLATLRATYNQNEYIGFDVIKKFDNNFGLAILALKTRNLPFNIYLLNSKSTTSIESPQIEESAYLYTYPPRPNPATQSVSAEVYWNSAYTLSESNISVYDIYGSKYNSNITFTSKEPFRAIINADCSNLATGIYFIRISVNGEYKTIPFTVVR